MQHHRSGEQAETDEVLDRAGVEEEAGGDQQSEFEPGRRLQEPAADAGDEGDDRQAGGRSSQDDGVGSPARHSSGVASGFIAQIEVR